MRTKIIGAGSIGNHLAHAARSLEWDVTVCDVNREALTRMREEIFPSRYGEWDPHIQLFTTDAVPMGGFDLVLIGTPPEHHLPLALAALPEEPKGILVEKPVCPPSLEGAQQAFDASLSGPTRWFVGYDHVVGQASRAATDALGSGAIGEVLTIDVEFREHWQGIFKAHPWLRGPEDSYLGFWARGGGASGEHSHALNLWQHFAHAAGAARVTEVDAMMTYVSNGRFQYDALCFLTLRTQRGLAGRVVQDVVTQPPSKRARLQGSNGCIEWINGFEAGADAVVIQRDGGGPQLYKFPKRRADDFIEELKHVATHLTAGESDIGLQRGLDTSLVVAAAHRSAQRGERVHIDYAAGYRPAALGRTPAAGND